MTVRAYECRLPGSAQVLGYVPLTRVEEWPAATQIVRLRVGADWRCARLDRSRVVEVDGMLLRDAVASDAADCPDCAPPPPAPAPEAAERGSDSSTQVQAAAISLRGLPMVVVLVRRELIDSPGEASMLLDDLRPRFGGAPVVLLGQDDDGTPHYLGDPALVDLLAGVPVERMPWKIHPLR